VLNTLALSVEAPHGIATNAKIKALQTHMLMKQKKKQHLKEKAADLWGDIEFSQDELDKMQEDYERYYFHLYML
jgi:hypothetical protein